MGPFSIHRLGSEFLILCTLTCLTFFVCQLDQPQFLYIIDICFDSWTYFFADKLAFYDVAAFIWTLGYVVLEAQLMIQLSSTIQLDSIKLSSTFNLNSVKKKISCLLADAYLNIQFFSHLLLLLGMIIKVSFKLISETFLGNGSGLFESR